MDTNLTVNRQIVSAFEFMAYALRCGYSVRQCLELIAKHIPEPTAGHIQALLAEMQNGGDFRAVLTGFQERMDSGYVRTFVDILLRQLQEGGNLADKLDGALKEVPAEVGRDAWIKEAIVEEGMAQQ